MSASAIVGSRMCEYVLVQTDLPGRGLENFGVLLLDPESGSAYMRFRRDFQAWDLEAEDRDFLEALGADLEDKSAEFGAEALVSWAEEWFSNTIRISGRERALVPAGAARAVLDRLYRQEVAPAVLPFRTHLPVYTLAAAAGKFSEYQEVEPEGWLETPAGVRLEPEMFVAHIAGRSMEPRIPDGSLGIFRAGVRGSRQGRIVLVENFGESGENRYTIKRYKSLKRQAGDSWEHDKIVLEPLNPEYRAWEIEDPSQVRVIAEFVDCLDSGSPAGSKT